MPVLIPKNDIIQNDATRGEEEVCNFKYDKRFRSVGNRYYLGVALLSFFSQYLQRWCLNQMRVSVDWVDRVHVCGSLAVDPHFYRPVVDNPRHVFCEVAWSILPLCISFLGKPPMAPHFWEQVILLFAVALTLMYVLLQHGSGWHPVVNKSSAKTQNL